MTFKPRTRCPHCRAKLEAGQRIHPLCIAPFADAQEAKSKRTAAKQQRAAAKVERAEIKKRKEALKRIPDHIRTAQQAFNAFIRARDAGKPCICCGRTQEAGYGKSSHGWDAGHYRSTGSASHLRFNEDNVHRQLVVCNRHGAGRAVDYRIGLIQRIGLERVEALESSNAPHKWTREQLMEITQVYRNKLKGMLK